jgi:hypothetical protein
VREPTPRVPKQDLPGRLSGDFNKQGEKKYPEGQCKFICAVHKELSGMIYISKSCYVPLHTGSCFDKFHSMKHQWTTYVQFSHNSAPKHHLLLKNVGKVAPCLIELNVCKISGNWSISLQWHTGLQCVNMTCWWHTGLQCVNMTCWQHMVWIKKVTKHVRSRGKTSDSYSGDTWLELSCYTGYHDWEFLW